MGDVKADASLPTRGVLSDVSNQIGKRKFVSVSSNSAPNSEEDSGSKNSVSKARQTDFARWMDSSSVKPKGLLNLGNGAESQKENSAPGVSRVPKGTMEISGLFDGNYPFIRREALKQSVIKRGDGLKVSSVSNVPGQCDKPPLILGGEINEKGTSIVDIVKNPIEDSALNKALTDVVGSNDQGVKGVDVASNKSGSIGCPMSSAPSGSQPLGSEKCTAVNGDGGIGTSLGGNLLNSCSCSFCRKAAYIWADLHYQDVKGRIAALKKSRKEVKFVLDKRCNYGEVQKNAEGNLDNTKKLELDLMGQWKLLFLHTENILARESNQLESSLISLLELRDNCKDDLEKMNTAPSTK